jgi:membrane-bound metal-dependent hydrolase YbcI (DUF457 family)
MPLPLGHFAIGLAVHETTSSHSAFSRRIIFAAIVVLANLPDVDVIIGLLVDSNGSAFHRGPTHSLLFAVMAGYLAAKALAAWFKLPQLGFVSCFLVILSHIAADALLTDSAVSFFWPLEAHWSTGRTGLGDVTAMVLKGNALEGWIMFGAAAFINLCFVARALRWERLVRSGSPRVLD